jgi:ABC-type transporter Mla maintaining outer membrane lipid asymmetry ATPase subunit MlaF
MSYPPADSCAYSILRGMVRVPASPGRSGMGKSVTLKLMITLLKPGAGHI